MAAQTRAWYQWPRHWQGFRDVPLKRLWLFAAAVFLIFSVIGFFNDLLQMGSMPYATVVLVGVVTGLNAVLFLNYLPWPFMVVALQFAMSLALARLEDALMACAGKPLSSVAQEILSKARSFGPQTDDQTLLLIRRSSQPAALGQALVTAAASGSA